MSSDAPFAATTSVMVVEDDPALRNDLVRTLSAVPELRVINATGSAREASRVLQAGIAPDVLLVDLGLPDGDGAALILQLRDRAPDAKALVLTVFADEERVVGALAAGAQGYLLKDAPAQEVVRAVREVRDGQAPLSPRVARYLLRHFAPANGQRAAHDERLSSREAQILTLVSHGQTAAQIADRLALSQHTVNTHLRNCYAKLHAHNRLQAVSRARDSGQIG
jgi:DNA-binding NarL/FixJ family response regulator